MRGYRSRVAVDRGSTKSFVPTRPPKSPTALAALAAAIALIEGAPPLNATTVTATWTGAVGASWSNAANWSPNTEAPNNGNGGISDFDVNIPDLTTQPTLDETATVDLLTLGNNASLSIQGGSSLTLNSSPIVDDGKIVVNSNNSSSSTIDFAGATLSGTGSILLNNASTTAVIAGTLTLGSGNSLSGLGNITAALTNNGVVSADLGAGTLNVNGNVTNTSAMQASIGGILAINGVTVTNTGGSIFAIDATVNLIGATVSGGTLSTAANGVIQAINSSTETLTNVNNDGTFNIVGLSNVSATGTTTNNGTITIDSNSSAASTLSATGPLAGTGTVVINNGGLLSFASNVGGSTLGGLTISGSGALNLNNNHLFIDYGTGPDPISTIAGYLAGGYAGGLWDGPGINSSAAAANSASYGLGYADSIDPGNPAGLSAGTIEIKYTLLGDVNLDGVVNGTDFGILAANFNKGVTGWDKGDFFYANIVNASDFGALAANFNKGAGGASIGEPAYDDPAILAFAAANGLLADVPEPASISLLALSSLGILARRRRIRRT